MSPVDALAGTLVARILSDDLHGDVPGRRLKIAAELAELSSRQRPEADLPKLWILNRFRNAELLEQYQHALGCVRAQTVEQRGVRLTEYASRYPKTRVLELPLDSSELNACADERRAVLYLANPNVARNTALAYGTARGVPRTFVLDGDIYVPAGTWEQAGRLLKEQGTNHPVWMFTVRAWSLDQFRDQCPPDSAGTTLVDTCENEFVLNSWPPRVIRLGDEGMLGLTRGAGFFDERLEYGRDPKVAYCAALRSNGAPLLTPSYPVCHLEHRIQPRIPDTLSLAKWEEHLLAHRLTVREAALRELSDWWQSRRVAGK